MMRKQKDFCENRSRRSATLPRALCALLLVGVACAAHGVTNVVHDAARDLVLNSANKAVYTNLYGGVWQILGTDNSV